MEKYQPVSCDLIDNLETHQVHRDLVEVEVRHENGAVEWLKGHILNIFTENHAEYVRMDGGRVIRLDCILDIRGLDPSTRDVVHP